MRLRSMAAGALALAGLAWLAVPTVTMASPARPAVPHYQHVFEIMMENTSYGQIIGNTTQAPYLNLLANEYGLATNYFGVTHPSEPNYVANVGGSYFGIQDDNQFYCTAALAGSDPYCGGTTVDHTVSAPNIGTELEAAGETWRGYFQSLPPTPTSYVTSGPGANGPYTFKWPSNANALYASKHNPFVNFTSTQGEVQNMVPDTQLATDLASGRLANYSLIVPDQCHDMHGTGSCPSTAANITVGDAYVFNTVNEIMAAPFWHSGRNAIVVTFDEDDFSDSGQVGTGCCGSSVGGGHVATIVITNKGPIHLTDSTAYNHYSLLRTIEKALGVPCLANACSADVPTMAPLFEPRRN